MEEQLLQQIKYYLSGKMTKEEYAELSEGHITHYGDKLNSKQSFDTKKPRNTSKHAGFRALKE